MSALLQDPFSPEAENIRISKRWEGREQDSRLDIECVQRLCARLSLVLIIPQVCRVSDRGYEKRLRRPITFVIARYTFVVLVSGIYALPCALNRTAANS